MHDTATYRRYAEGCRRLANIVAKEHRDALLRIAEAWTELANESERQKLPQKPPPC